jgi:GNAT superfamily N-acetyltransferase
VADAEAVAPLVAALGYPTQPSEMRERLATILEDGSYAAFVAERGSNILGLAGVRLGSYFEKNWSYVQLVILVVDEAGRGMRVGTALVDAAEQYARTKGAKELIVNSGSHRADAHRFYEARGFRETGFRFVKALDEY